MGVPSGCEQYVSRPGMRKIEQSGMVAAARGVHRWLQRPHEEDEGATSAGSSGHPLNKATRVAPRGTMGGDKPPVPRGQPGEALPAVLKRAKRGKGNEESHAGAEGDDPQQTNNSTLTPPPHSVTGKRGDRGVGKRPVLRGQPGEVSLALEKRNRWGEGDQEPRMEAKKGRQAKIASTPQQAGDSMPPPPLCHMTGKGGGAGEDTAAPGRGRVQYHGGAHWSHCPMNCRAVGRWPAAS